MLIQEIESGPRYYQTLGSSIDMGSIILLLPLLSPNVQHTCVYFQFLLLDHDIRQDVYVLDIGDTYEFSVALLYSETMNNSLTVSSET